MRILNFIIASWVLLFFIGCSEPAEKSIHPKEWLTVGSNNSHMEKIAVSGIAGCKSCHGGPEYNDYFGGTSSISCYDCHEGGPSGHPAWSLWMDKNAENFHGKAMDTRGKDDCKKCHGEKLDGGVADLSCQLCHET
ncbi:MAG: hypothetical protein ISR82_03360 [Candidatus Marinimicrobia bacterium]|nr:hypothetical protein [Candidatus Neomarinimicrobiota bacterium]MBL7010241.1 hypothetical protein [Candidatus Neomarinimicrobiota bacterium]MBL7030656.1 hypothetical protein [Candidatus Neomarinimicrobiota bacterium]